MKFYTVKDEYINYLRKFDKKVMQNKDSKHARPYFGIITEINKQKYLVPLSSPKYLKDFFIIGYDKKDLPSDFPNSKKYEIKMIYETSVPVYYLSVPVYYLIDKDNEGKINLLGKLKFNAMIPVTNSVITNINFKDEEDEKYRNLLYKQYRHLKGKDKYLLENHALKIYNQKLRKVKKNYISKATINFSLLEKKCKDWESK